LFEGYNKYDLTYLKGHAIILPKNDLVNKHDDIIVPLDSILSPIFNVCYNNTEKRLDALFQIKDKWT
jgi:hypothetical protein